MKKQFLLFLTLLFLNNYCKAQETSFTIIKGKENNNWIISVKVFNNTDKTQIFYRPTKDDFCNGIISLSFVNKNNQKIDFPCKDSPQIDHIQINCNNSFILNRNESIILKYYFNINEKFVSNNSRYRFQLNYRDTDFTNIDSNTFFKGILVSEGKIRIRY
jgi:hypothetical protein